MTVQNLWARFIYFLINNHTRFKTIFIHNLGSFDGLFLYKALTNYYGLENLNNVSTLIDDKNKFIRITLIEGKDVKIVWKDSYRIFNVSLEDLWR